MMKGKTEYSNSFPLRKLSQFYTTKPSGCYNISLVQLSLYKMCICYRLGRSKSSGPKPLFLLSSIWGYHIAGDKIPY